MAGLFDGAFDPIGSGILPGWLATQDIAPDAKQGAMPPWLTNALANLQQGGMPGGMSGANPMSGFPAAQGPGGQPPPQPPMPPAMSFGDRWNPTADAMGPTGAFNPPGLNLLGGGGPQEVSPQAMQAWRQGADNGGITPTTTPLDANGRPVGESTGLPANAKPAMGQAPQQPPQGGAMPSALNGTPVPQMPSLPSLSGLLGLGGAPAASATGGAASAPGFGDRLSAGLAGFANGGAPLPALANLIGGLATGKRQDPEGFAREQHAENQAAAEKAYVDSGVPAPIARAMALNPEVAKIAAPEYFSGWKLVKTGSNPITGDQYKMQGPGGQLRDLDSFVKGGGAAGASLGASMTSGMLAPGVKQYDPSLVGDPYMAQFSPELQAAAKAYMRGDVMPNGNPRLQGVANAAKLVAQTYAAGIGKPELASDALYREKAKYRTELGSTSATTAGGQAKAFDQGIEHADGLATKLEGLQNWNGLGVPFLASGANYMREAFSNNQKGLATEARALGQTLAGEVGKLFSGSAGGGVHEREMTRDRFKTISSGPELAGALEGTIETMEGGLKALETRRDQILGPNSDVTFLTKEAEGKIAHIREIIARLKSGEAAPAATGSPAVAGKPTQVTQGGHTYTLGSDGNYH